MRSATGIIPPDRSPVNESQTAYYSHISKAINQEEQQSRGLSITSHALVYQFPFQHRTARKTRRALENSATPNKTTRPSTTLSLVQEEATRELGPGYLRRCWNTNRIRPRKLKCHPSSHTLGKNLSCYYYYLCRYAAAGPRKKQCREYM